MMFIKLLVSLTKFPVLTNDPNYQLFLIQEYMHFQNSISSKRLYHIIWSKANLENYPWKTFHRFLIHIYHINVLIKFLKSQNQYIHCQIKFSSHAKAKRIDKNSLIFKKLQKIINNNFDPISTTAKHHIGTHIFNKISQLWINFTI